jgi:hypothetical protein
MDFNPTVSEKKIGSIGVFYGLAGIGKTTTIATAVKEVGDKGLFVSCGEDGLSPLQQNDKSELKGLQRLPETIKDWGTMMEAVRWIAKQEYEVVAFDSISLLMKNLEDYCFEKYYVQDAQAHGQNKTVTDLRKKAYGFAKSELIAYMSKEWDSFITAVQYLREKGVTVLISSHTALKKAKIVTEDLEYDYGDLDMPQTKHVSLGTALTDIADFVLYGKRDVTVFKGEKKNVAGGSNDRVYCTQESPMFKAKNRYDMNEEIPASWEEIKKYL